MSAKILMGTSFAASIDRLGPYLKTLGFVALLLVGLGVLLEAVSAFVIAGYIATLSGYSFSTADGVWVALVALLLIISILTIVASMVVKRGNFPGSMAKVVLLLAAISLLVQGGGMYAISTSTFGGWATSAALAIAAGVILLLALFISMRSSMGMKLTGSIFAIVFASLLITKLASMTGAQAGGRSLSSAFIGVASVPSGSPVYYFSGLSTGATWTGTVGFTYLALIAFLVVAVALLFRAILSTSKMAPVAWIVALIGFLLYGIDMAWGNINALTNIGNIQNWSTGATPVVAAIVLTVAAFIIMAASIIGMVFYGGSLGGMAMAQPSMAQAQPTQATGGTFCPSCGTQNPTENTYCKKCGAKLG